MCVCVHIASRLSLLYTNIAICFLTKNFLSNFTIEMHGKLVKKKGGGFVIDHEILKPEPANLKSSYYVFR